MSWNDVLLGDLFHVGSSKRVLKADWKKEGIPFYRGREITALARDGQVSNNLFVTEELYKDYSRKYGVPTAGDIMVTAIGTIGNSYIVQDYDKFYFKDASVLWLKKSSDINSQFINFWLKSPLFKGQLNKGNGATVDTLTISKLKSVKVDLPPLGEQKRIVAILDETFEGIEKAQANAEKNLANARELFESQMNAMLTRHGDEWQEKTFSKVCSITSSLVDPREEEFINLPHIGAGNMVSMTGELEDVKTAREEKLKSGKFHFDEGMVLYSKIRPYLMKVCKPSFSGLCSADVYPLQPNPEIIERDYLFYLFLSKNFTEHAISGSARAGMPKVNRTHLFNYKTSYPPLAEQNVIVQKINHLSEATSKKLSGEKHIIYHIIMVLI